MACLANTPGGGAIVLGVADDGVRIGTSLEPEWLRYRIWQLTEQRLTVAVREVDLGGTRLLVLMTHEAIEPIRFAGRLLWRVEDNCVEIDPTTWHAGKLQRSGFDWSAQPSGHTFDDVRATAIDLARRYLMAGGDEASLDLAAASDQDLIRRLHLVGGDGTLTNAGPCYSSRPQTSALTTCAERFQVPMPRRECGAPERCLSRCGRSIVLAKRQIGLFTFQSDSPMANFGRFPPEHYERPSSMVSHIEIGCLLTRPRWNTSATPSP